LPSNTQVLRTISLQSPSTPGQSEYIYSKYFSHSHNCMQYHCIKKFFKNKENKLKNAIIGLVTIPLQNTKVATSKAGESVMTKTIQLTSAQMVNMVL